MKSELRKNGGGEQGSPPRTPFVLLNFYSTLPKSFLQKLECICRSRPNIQALEKHVAKMEIFILPHLYWPEISEMFQKTFLVNVLTLYFSNQAFIGIKN